MEGSFKHASSAIISKQNQSWGFLNDQVTLNRVVKAKQNVSKAENKLTWSSDCHRKPQPVLRNLNFSYYT